MAAPGALLGDMVVDVLPPRVADLVPPVERVRRRRRTRHWYRRRRRRVARALLCAVGVVVAVAAGQLFWAWLQMYQAQRSIASAQVALSLGDLDTARVEIAEANVHADRAGWGTWGPHLAAGERLPGLGDDLHAVRETVAVTREATGPVAEDLLRLRNILDPRAIRPTAGGQVDVERFVLAGAGMHEAAERMTVLDRRLASLERDGLVAPLRGRVDLLTEEVRDLTALTTYADGVLDMVPELLGADGPRSYLVVFQNNAELRSTGGIPGAFAVLEADDGFLSMREQGSVPDLGGHRDEPVLPQTAEEVSLFDGKLGTFVQNPNLGPDWGRSGELLAEMWRQIAGEDVDGVLSVDPVTLSYVLRGTGPVALEDGHVARADNAVQLLLNQAYLDYPDQATQNDFFEDSARRIFDSLVRGHGNAGVALRGLYDGVREGRGLAWLADPVEQERLSGGIIAGELSDGGERPDVGVFLNDSTGTKLDFYVRSLTNVTRVSCRDDGGQVLRVETLLSSRVPPGVAMAPRLLRGASVDGELLTTVLAYGPAGSTISDPTIDGRTGAPAYFTHDGHPVVARTVLLEPGQTIEFAWTVETRPGQSGPPVLRTTPGAQSSGLGRVEQSGC